MTSNFYITTPIYYVNDKPHIGHAYTSVACDVAARFMRLSGRRTFFLTGTDEHGQKVEKSAESAGIPPQTFVDEVSEHFRTLTETLNISNDDFIRTTQPRHIKAAQAIWKKLEEAGDIYLDKYAGWYSVRDEAFYSESELTEDKKAPTGSDVEWVEEPSYFFKLSAWEDKLLQFYEDNPDFILPKSRRNEVISFVKSGLKDLSISRTTFKWGVPVPDNEEHIMYVWLDALTNYLTAIGYPDTDSEKYNAYWPASIHMVGKDILRFHAIYWPAFLLSANIEPPKCIFAHGWWTLEGEKMSKSLGNVVAPDHLVEKYGLDQTRYFLMREVPFGNDGNFSRTAMIERINSDLSNNIGNLAQRTLSMIQKNCDGAVPDPKKVDTRPQDKQLLDMVRVTESDSLEVATQAIEKCKFNDILHSILNMSSAANEYIDREAPWKQKKEAPEEMEATLYTLSEAIRCISIMLQPFIPDSSSKLLDQLAIPEDQRSFSHLTEEFALKPGTALPKPEVIFPRFQMDEAA
ncbi:MAG: methionine--tRNA ligase [Rickettsiales bacterium]|nr:methionine--tRNA ligase [Rickettsiales bacterium]